jgi:hypothetical protein
VSTYKFEATIWFPDDYPEPDEDYMDLQAFYYGDKHHEYALHVVPGTIQKVEKK